MFPAWFSFLIVLILILISSKIELAIILSFAALVFSLLTGVNIFEGLISIFTEPSIILLAFSISLIPILGGILNESGMMLELIQKLRISNKMSLILSPSLFGMLPVAGGALMSAPIVDQIDPKMLPHLKVGINVWYRHVLLLIYPLSSLVLVASLLSGIPVYNIIFALLIPFIIMNLIGYYYFLRSVEHGKKTYKRDLKRVFHNLTPLVLAPMVDILGRLIFPEIISEIFLPIGLSLSILLAYRMSDLNHINLKRLIKEISVWRFPALIFSMFLFLEIFIRSGVPEEISSINLPFGILIFLGFFLGFATGRVQLPISILVPIYLTQYSLLTMPLIEFTFIYVSIYLGYLITPIHPCLAYNIKYFKTDYRKSIHSLLLATFSCFMLLIGAYLIYMLF